MIPSLGEQLCQKVEPVSDTFVDEHVLSWRHQADMKFSQNGIHSWFVYQRPQFFVNHWSFAELKRSVLRFATYCAECCSSQFAFWCKLAITWSKSQCYWGHKNSKLAFGSTIHRVVARTYLKRTHTHNKVLILNDYHHYTIMYISCYL